MRLGEIAGTDSSAVVTGFALDHRKVAPGNIFGAFRGGHFNGEDFIADAVRLGSDYLVIGRPVTRSADPARTLSEILDTLRAGAALHS